jgi:tetratricopeptide (TPR) repeat protein
VKDANPPPGKVQLEAREQAPKIAEAEIAIKQGKYAQALQLLEEAISNNVKADDKLKGLVISTLGQLSWDAIKNGDFDITVKAGEDVLALNKKTSNKIGQWIYKNLAHAHMFLGNTIKAREIYMRGRGSRVFNDKYLWDELVLEDFEKLRGLGKTSPLMEEIESIFKEKLTVKL